MSSPKEKSQSIIDKYRMFSVMWCGGVDVENQNVKQCALIAVDEMLNLLNEFNPDDIKIKWKKVYYDKVKEEIEKL